MHKFIEIKSSADDEMQSMCKQLHIITNDANFSIQGLIQLSYSEYSQYFMQSIVSTYCPETIS